MRGSKGEIGEFIVYCTQIKEDFENLNVNKNIISTIAKKSEHTIAGMRPSFSAIQLIPTTGNKLKRTIARRLSCLAMKLAAAGEYL